MQFTHLNQTICTEAAKLNNLETMAGVVTAPVVTAPVVTNTKNKLHVNYMKIWTITTNISYIVYNNNAMKLVKLLQMTKSITNTLCIVSGAISD